MCYIIPWEPDELQISKLTKYWTCAEHWSRHLTDTDNSTPQQSVRSFRVIDRNLLLVAPNFIDEEAIPERLLNDILILLNLITGRCTQWKVEYSFKISELSTTVTFSSNTMCMRRLPYLSDHADTDLFFNYSFASQQTLWYFLNIIWQVSESHIFPGSPSLPAISGWAKRRSSPHQPRNMAG